MTKYAADHAGALADLAEAGAAVTFALAVPGVYDPATDTTTAGTSASVAGQAIRLPGDARRYEALGLTEREAVTLLFAPTTYGANPAVGAAFTWGGETFTCASVDPLALDGTTLLATIVGRR